MSEIRDFLLARVADDELQALDDMERRGLRANDSDAALEDADPLREFCVSPNRVRQDCHAKRRRIEYLTGPAALFIPADVRDNLLRIEAMPYVEHPDFRDEWRQ